MPSRVTAKSSSDSTTAPVCVSRTEVRVEKDEPAYESPYTNTVHDAMRPDADRRARFGVPDNSTRRVSRSWSSRTRA